MISTKQYKPAKLNYRNFSPEILLIVFDSKFWVEMVAMAAILFLQINELEKGLLMEAVVEREGI